MVAYFVLSSSLLNAISLGSALRYFLGFRRARRGRALVRAFLFAVRSRDCRLASRPRPNRARGLISRAALSRGF